MSKKSSADICSSDLCYFAAEKLLEELHWDRTEIDVLVFVTQTPDYIVPATSCLLQQRLGLKESCYTLDISLGCSGWVYALSVITSLMRNGSLWKGLLSAGDTILKVASSLIKVLILCLVMRGRLLHWNILPKVAVLNFRLIQTVWCTKLLLYGTADTAIRFLRTVLNFMNGMRVF